MGEIRIAVACEADALELCAVHGWQFSHTYEGRGSNRGQTMMLAYENSGMSNVYEEYAQEILSKQDVNKALGVKQKQEKWVVCTAYSPKQLLYKSKNGVTFQQCEARIFNSRESAETTARCMLKRGNYRWTVKRIR